MVGRQRNKIFSFSLYFFFFLQLVVLSTSGHREAKLLEKALNITENC